MSVPSKRKPGRPTLYTPQLAKKIARLYGQGLSKESAAEACGVALSTLCDWQNKKPEFLELLTRARAGLKATLIRRIERGTREDARLALEWLSRLWPDEYARKQRLEHSGPAGGAIPVQIDDIRKLSDEELAAIANGGE